MPSNKTHSRNPWYWIPSLYLAEGLPYTVVMTVSVIMYKRMGISNADIALYTSWLYLPWVIKPFWSPVVDILKTKRFWIVTMQFIIGVGLAGVALTIPVPNFFRYTLMFFWLLAFSSATHDISADGFYMLGLSEHDQAWFVGIRSTFYRIAFITGQGLLVILAGYIESHSGLGAINIKVTAQPATQIYQTLDTANINFSKSFGSLGILSSASDLSVSTIPRSKSEVDSIINFAKSWNMRHGFYQQEKIQSKGKSLNHKKLSWWDENVVQNLENFLKKNFGENKKINRSGNYSGNIGLIYFKLSKPPGKNVAVNFGRESGDKSIDLIEGKRFSVNNSNWNIPSIAVVQLDPKLKTESSALFKASSGNIPLAWIAAFIVLTAMFIFFFTYHKFILPYPESDKPAIAGKSREFFSEFITTFVLFFKKKKIVVILLFILFYRFGEAQLVKLATPFLLDAQEAGGLALTTGQVGFVYGTVGILALTFGGILGGFLTAKNGLKYWLWWMLAAINLPDLVYVYLSYTQTSNILIINIMVALEQFGYGFGFTAFMLYLIYISEGDFKTSHYAIATGLMALGMMLPGMLSGWLQEIIGYRHFFIWVCLSTIPVFIIAKFVPVRPDFGMKKNEANT